MSSQVLWQPELNYGRIPAPYDGPINNDWIYRDPDTTLPIRLLSYQKVSGIPIPPRERHWSLAWVVDHGANNRVLDVRVENGYKHYTFWGAITSSIDPLTKDPVNCTIVEVGQLTLPQRVQLEELALQVQVWQPNGEWNCQD